MSKESVQSIESDTSLCVRSPGQYHSPVSQWEPVVVVKLGSLVHDARESTDPGRVCSTTGIGGLNCPKSHVTTKHMKHFPPFQTGHLVHLIHHF